MNTLECAREEEVVGAVLGQRWPEACDEELQVHVTACAVCSDVVIIASMLREDRELARRHVQVPAAGQVWWRAAVRARLEGAQAAQRPMTWLHGIAGACAAGLFVTAMSTAWPSVQRAAGWMGAQDWSVPGGMELATLAGSAVQRGLPFVVAAAIGIVLTPIALYFALSDD